MSKYPCLINFYKYYSEQEPELIYVGSTKNTISKRQHQHKYINNMCCSKLITNKYDDAKIELIKQLECKSKVERNEIENAYIDCFDAINVIKNSIIDVNYDDPQLYFKLYREHHKEKYKLQKAEYYLNNKEHLDNKNKQHYINNKAKILAVQSERIICECGKEIARGKKARHIKTQSHIALVNR